MAFFLERVVGGGFTDEFDGGSVYFPLLSFAWGFDEFAGDANRGTGGHFRNVIIAGNAGISDALDIGEAGAVVHFQKGKLLGVTAGSNPAFDSNGVLWAVASQRILNKRSHGCDFYVPKDKNQESSEQTSRVGE